MTNNTQPSQQVPTAMTDAITSFVNWKLQRGEAPNYKGDGTFSYIEQWQWEAFQAGIALAQSAPANAERTTNASDILITLNRLLDAPTLHTQVFVAARMINGWPFDASIEAAKQAEADYGSDACRTADALQSVLREVLRTDGDGDGDGDDDAAKEKTP
jgi:hypothetical protein